MKNTKKERRKKRYLRNVKKEKDYKESAWNRGKLIEENHNGESYSFKYSKELGKRLSCLVSEIKSQAVGMDLKSAIEYSLLKFRLYRQKIQDYILHYPLDLPKSEEYLYLKQVIETYWDTPEKLIDVL